MMKHVRTTSYIKHLAEFANIKISTLNNNCSYLIENSFELPNVHRRNRYG